MRGVMSGGAAATEEVSGLRAALEQARAELQQVRWNLMKPRSSVLFLGSTLEQARTEVQHVHRKQTQQLHLFSPVLAF